MAITLCLFYYHVSWGPFDERCRSTIFCGDSLERGDVFSGKSRDEKRGTPSWTLMENGLDFIVIREMDGHGI